MGRVPLGSLALVCIVLMAGCAGAPLSNDADTTGTQPQTTEQSATPTPGPTVVPRAPLPEPPATLTNDTARDIVLEYESARLQNVLRKERDVTYFEVGYVSPPAVTVLNDSADGIRLRVDGTYSYGTETASADGVPFCSIYTVKKTDIRYISDAEC